VASAGLLRPGHSFLWLAGRSYLTDLMPLLSDYPQSDPLRGLRMGQRLAWLSSALESR